MDRLAFLSSLSAAVAAGTLKVPSTGLPAAVAGIEIPQTLLAQDATAVALSSEPIEVFRHSLRTFLFAELIARKRASSTTASSSTSHQFYTIPACRRNT